MSDAQVGAALVAKYGTAEGDAIYGQHKQVISDSVSNWARSVPAVAERRPLLGAGWRPAALTLTLGEPAHSSCRVGIGPATRESA
jgi:hypothetical protein